MHLNCNVRVVDVEPTNVALGLKKGTYTFYYTYPLSKKVSFEHVLGPKTTQGDILVLARADYERIYREEDEDMGKKTKEIPGMLNRAKSEGRHGIWGHHIDDLYFESIEIKGLKVEFGIGS